MPKIPNEILAILSQATTDGPRLYLPGQLDRKTYQDVNKVLEANGGKWNRGAKAHVFSDDAADAIEQALLTGEFRRVKQELGQFDTPPEIVARLIELAEIEPGMNLLEPSAGIGNIALAAMERDAVVVTVEIDPKRAAELTMRILKSGIPAASLCEGIFGDFLAIAPHETLYDRVVMNPPFAKQADIDHVTHALKFLRPGGRLVSVMSAGVLFRTDRKTASFRERLEGRGARIDKLPPDAFKESGTSVNAVILAVDV